MPQIDLEPKDYHAQPLKGEKVFAAGGLRRLAIVAGWFVFAIAVAFFMRPIAEFISGVTFPLIWPDRGPAP